MATVPPLPPALVPTLVPPAPRPKTVAKGMPKLIRWEGYTFTLQCVPLLGSEPGDVECHWGPWSQDDDYGPSVRCPRCGGSISRDVLIDCYRMNRV